MGTYTYTFRGSRYLYGCFFSIILDFSVDRGVDSVDTLFIYIYTIYTNYTNYTIRWFQAVKDVFA